MKMQYILGEDTYKQLESCIDNKIHSNLFRFLRLHKMCFIKPEWEFLNDKHHEVSNFDGLPQIHKSKIKESSTNTQNSEVIIVIFEPKNFKLKLIVGGPECPARKLSQLLFFDCISGGVKSKI